ncbi:MAG: leucyl/phenylalanyl-tRNA--protein transferase [Myxococcales bacterium]|nr:MAG: leucyl/phenylalanyl-tRNA--protein transferase [Myxococcales bacterium]
MTPPGEDDWDIVGAGADLEPGTLLAAYRAGIFPMPDDEFGLAWFSPRQRGVLSLRDLRVSRSMRQSARTFEIRVNTAFDEVMEGCADPRRPGGWIDDDIRRAYGRLHRLGWAHSVETWRDGELVGGLYGVALGGLFAGESMFHRARDASKVALMGLVELLSDEYAERRLIDTQWQTQHLATLGVRELDREVYVERLPELLEVPVPAAFT